MAINPANADSRAKLQRAVAHHWTQNAGVRERRKKLYELYKGRPDTALLLPNTDTTLVNLIQAFVLGQVVSMAWRGPKWSVKARTLVGQGFDLRVQNFLTRYSEVLELPRIFRQAAIDSCFGWSAVKVVDSIAPKGVYAPYAPRAYRISPNALILDGTASSFDEAAFIADTYLAPLDEARAYFPGQEHRLQPWSGITSSSDASQNQNTEAYAQDYTRLIDVYLPSLGVLATWPSNTDRFAEIAEEPLQIIPTRVNPYEILSLLNSPDTIQEMARLDALRDLHLLANDMLYKAAQQARKSKRNPIAQMGADHDLHSILNKADTEGALVEDLSKIGLYTIPGPDAAVTNMAGLAMQLFSQYGGNLEVALGQSAGAGTARQTQSLIQQINARQSVDRESYERFAANVGKKLATLAFDNEALELEYRQPIPGTRYTFNAGWAPPHLLPRPAKIDDFNFEVVPYSTEFRTPQNRIEQLTQVSGQFLQFMQIAASGAPINLAAVLRDYAEAYDSVPQLTEWWSGETPDPTQNATKSSQYVAQPGPNGSQVQHTYSSDAGSGGDDGFATEVTGNTPGAGGLTIPQVGGI